MTALVPIIMIICVPIYSINTHMFIQIYYICIIIKMYAYVIYTQLVLHYFVFINYFRILLYGILIDSLSQMICVLDCGLVFKYMLVNFDWPLLSRIHLPHCCLLANVCRPTCIAIIYYQCYD